MFTALRSTFWAKWLVRGALSAGLALSLISILELCSESCKSSHDWTLFGIPFGPIGIAFFSLTLALTFWKGKEASLLLSLLLFGALGSEIMLVFFQKSKIGHFCPVCLATGAIILFVSLFFIYDLSYAIRRSLNSGNKGEIMNDLWRGTFALSLLLIGFMTTFVGLTQSVSPLAAMERDIKDQMAFGNLKSPVQAFLFTDWSCPACRSLESKLYFILPSLTKEIRFTFVDFPVHPETLNFAPYNLSFMVYNKDKYLRLRDRLTELSTTTKQPSDPMIAELANKEGVRYRELPYSEVSLGLQYWKDLGDQFSIDGTPILVIINPTLKKGKKLSGIEEINEANITRAISTLSSK